MSTHAPVHAADPPPVTQLSQPDLIAEHDLYQLLIQETQHLGKHGATPHRRSAAGRVELKLTHLQQQLTPHLG